MPDKETIRELIMRAMGMMKMSYIPYSHFSVGAALLTDSGEIYTGCNIENAAYTPSVCAERTAFFKAVSEGHTSFKAIAVTGGMNRKAEDFCTPCGVCRQVMREFVNDDFVVYMGGAEGYEAMTMAQILPAGFKASEHMAL
jgi:cytidine deaminase